MSKKVEIYTTPACHFCHAAKEYFGEKNIEFTDYNVATDMEKRKEMIEKTSQMGVPVIIVSNGAEGEQQDIVIGFDEPKLAKLLGV
ncbi:MAG TPA: glutaredoxin domain-containing protein [Candidatus Paceibacterota bacterium]|jgi:glutaredoxin-like YruB-family protein|nr:NrdH-redoxin [Parcubacteria group bacterium]MDP6119561.1 glutaredoxin domain-containing protein [Candidatus Paceibacterota bacterium]HJN63027.1 glutaredoxin domain-containing protein [Candidatus Paceibacterota bacterium]|tara:strand:+ start:2021 stop:2278 length:258 start_codon:yes stop_codon:yes gene_type:complete